MVESDVTRSRSRDRKIERFIHFTSFKHRNLTPKTLSRQHHGTIVDRTYVKFFVSKKTHCVSIMKLISLLASAEVVGGSEKQLELTALLESHFLDFVYRPSFKTKTVEHNRCFL